MKLADLLKEKNKNLIAVGRDAHISFIYEVMKSNRVHHIAVTRDHQFLGLVDQEALLDAIMISPQNCNSLEAQDIMRRHVPEVRPDFTIEDVVKLMKEKGLPALPYIEDGRCTTLITRSDILRMVYDHVLETDPGDDLLDKAIKRSDLAMTNPIVHRISKMLADIGI